MSNIDNELRATLCRDVYRTRDDRWCASPLLHIPGWALDDAQGERTYHPDLAACQTALDAVLASEEPDWAQAMNTERWDLRDPLAVAVTRVRACAVGHPDEPSIRAMLDAGDYLTPRHLEQDQYAGLPRPLLIALVEVGVLAELSEPSTSTIRLTSRWCDANET